MDLFWNLFSSQGFKIRSECGPSWTHSLVLSSELANLIIVFGYVILAVELLTLYFFRNLEIKGKISFQLLILFPIVCSLSRLANVLIFWWAPYRLFILLDWLCAFSIISLTFVFRDLINYLLNLDSFRTKIANVDQLNMDIEKHGHTERGLQVTNDYLVRSVKRLEYIIESEMWLNDKKIAIKELQEILKDNPNVS